MGRVSLCYSIALTPLFGVAGEEPWGEEGDWPGRVPFWPPVCDPEAEDIVRRGGVWLSCWRLDEVSVRSCFTTTRRSYTVDSVGDDVDPKIFTGRTLGFLREDYTHPPVSGKEKVVYEGILSHWGFGFGFLSHWGSSYEGRRISKSLGIVLVYCRQHSARRRRPRLGPL